MSSNFYAVLSRMKYINRWGLMRNTRPESLSEHSLEAAFFAHALVLIYCRRFGGRLSPDRAAVLAMFHDASEIITGDLPTPVKYYNDDIRRSYKMAEAAACTRLAEFLPDDIRADIEPLIREEDEQYRPFIKAADKLSALAKCIEERRMGNSEFAKAEQAQRAAIAAMRLPAADAFLAEFMDSYALTLDELGLQK